MANVVGDLMYPKGKYVKDGEEKTSWLKCGVLLEVERDGRKSMRLKIDCMPVGAVADGGLWFSVFEPRESGFKNTKSAKPDTGFEEEDRGDVPF